jgi:hypothetical protein
MKITRVKSCGEILYGRNGFKAKCLRKWGTEHSHNDETAEQAVSRKHAAIINFVKCVER